MFAPSSYSVSGLSYFFPAVSLPIFYKCSPSFFSKVSASFSLPLNAKNGFHFLTGSGNESIFISSSIFPHLIPDPSPFPCHPFQKCPIQSTSGPIHPLSYPHFIMDFFSINQTFQGPHFFPKAKSFPCLFSYQEGHKMGRISHVLLTFPFYPLLIHPHIPQPSCGFVLPSFPQISYFPHQFTPHRFLFKFTPLNHFWRYINNPAYNLPAIRENNPLKIFIIFPFYHYQ